MFRTQTNTVRVSLMYILVSFGSRLRQRSICEEIKKQKKYNFVIRYYIDSNSLWHWHAIINSWYYSLLQNTKALTRNVQTCDVSFIHSVSNNGVDISSRIGGRTSNHAPRRRTKVGCGKVNSNFRQSVFKRIIILRNAACAYWGDGMESSIRLEELRWI